MRFLTLFLAFFIAFTSAAKTKSHKYYRWGDRYKHHAPTKTEEATKTLPPTMTAANIPDPRCKKDADCAPGTCMNGICVDGAGAAPPKTTEFWFSLDDLDKIPLKPPTRRDLGEGAKCKTNNDCAKDKKRPWCSTHYRCVADRPPGKECHMDSNCEPQERCYKARCMDLKQIAEQLRDWAGHKTLSRSGRKISFTRREEPEDIEEPGDDFDEDDGVPEEHHVREKRRYHMTSQQLPGVANNEGEVKGCPNGKEVRG